MHSPCVFVMVLEHVFALGMKIMAEITKVEEIKFSQSYAFRLDHTKDDYIKLLKK